MAKRKRAVCPCGSARLYERCCGRWHDGESAPTAETLMRSRYAAYSLGLVDYIVGTTDPLGPFWREDETVWREEIRRFSADTRFVGLRIVHGRETGDDATVTFEAHFVRGDRPDTMRERSTFVRRDGRWFYRDGESV